MGKKNKKRTKAAKRRSAIRPMGWSKIKLYAMLVFIGWVSLAANGYELSFPTLAGVDGIARASAFSFMPTVAAPTPDRPASKDHVVGVAGPIRPIPDGLNNFRGRGITPEQLRTFLATSGTKKLMNLSGDIPGKITAAEARMVCAEFNVEYLTSGHLNRFAARSGYQEGKGFVRSAAAAARHLAGGNVLVIDRSGNRSGAMIGAYLVSVHDFSVAEAIAHNNWEYFATSPGRSYKYLETVTGKPEKPTE